MLIKRIVAGPFDTNAYVVSVESGEAMIVDPAPGSAAAIGEYVVSHELVPQKIVLTHSHWDHIADVAELKRRFDVPVFIHGKDAGNLEKPGSDGLPCWIRIEGVVPDGLLAGGDVVRCGSLSFEVIETPGHTPGGICLHEAGEGVLLSGDTLFKGSIGKVSFSTGDAEKMWESLDKLAALPPATRVYPGHGGRTTIGQESWLPDARRVFG